LIKYLLAFSKHRSAELKIIIIDNAGFHSLTKYEIPQNIKLVRIPLYSPELNPSEKIWAYIKQYYKNRVFGNLENVKSWLHHFVKENMTQEIVKSITHNNFFLNAFYDVF